MHADDNITTRSTAGSTAGSGLDSIGAHEMSRRGVLRIGGLTIGLAALIAACGDDADTNPARVGALTPTPTLPDGVVSDGVLFRTATSMHFSVIDAHNIVKTHGGLTAEQTAVVDAFIAAHEAAIEDVQEWTQTAGSTPWTCANPRFDRVVLGPITDRLTGRPREGAEETDVPPSDDPNRDAMSLAFAAESVLAATYQFFVPQFSQPQYRAPAIAHGTESARRAAALALIINPDNLVAPTTLANANLEAPTTSAAAPTEPTQDIAQEDGADTSSTVAAAAGVGTVQQHYAIPSQFGLLTAVPLAIGAFGAGGQVTINIETPSLNSFVYDYQSEC